ncbi:MAG: hypothetical protein QOJ99_486 [Bryobacterales bacterium]|jgi:type IV pilus assembly protein PilB|nr:hypothetical protein [Bryobacterales bacterium]
MSERIRLGEILTGSGWITADELKGALATKPEGRRLGEHLLRLGLLGEDDLYAALSLQSGLPRGKPDPAVVSLPVTRALPVAVARKWRVLPFRIAAGELYLAGSDLPGEAMQKEVGRFSSLEIRFHLVTATEFDELAAEYLI